MDAYELEKVRNKFESDQLFANMNYVDLAANMALFELLGKAEDLNLEVERYRSVRPEDIMRVAGQTFVRENCCTLYYKRKGHE